MRLSLLIAAILFSSPLARAESKFGTSQLHMRTGMLSAKFSGAASGSFSIPTAIDLDLELFTRGNGSYAIRSILAHDFSQARLMYAYVGGGTRYYLGPSGLSYDDSAGGAQVILISRWRYYLSGDLGISQVVVKTFGPVLQASSALFDVAAGGGVIRQISRTVGLEAHLGYGLGYGFSSVSVAASTLRALLGLSFHF